MQCEVAFACDLPTVDCIKTAEMIHSLALLLESAADRITQRERADFVSGIVTRIERWRCHFCFILSDVLISKTAVCSPYSPA